MNALCCSLSRAATRATPSVHLTLLELVTHLDGYGFKVPMEIQRTTFAGQVTKCRRWERNCVVYKNSDGMVYEAFDYKGTVKMLGKH